MKIEKLEMEVIDHASVAADGIDRLANSLMKLRGIFKEASESEDKTASLAESDIESRIFTTIATTLRAEFSDIFILGEFTQTPPQFPCVIIIERSSANGQRSFDLEQKKYRVSAMYDYDVEIYANSLMGKKTQCKKIRNVIDAEFFKLGFAKTSSESITNRDISKAKLHYQGIVSSVVE